MQEKDVQVHTVTGSSRPSPRRLVAAASAAPERYVAKDTGNKKSVAVNWFYYYF